ncbi:MAG: hypothetical protein LBL73_00880 [Synergistaceae bacterium]|nr:hypothetical protein [Synergistaceae bacterium]
MTYQSDDSCQFSFHDGGRMTAVDGISALFIWRYAVIRLSIKGNAVPKRFNEKNCLPLLLISTVPVCIAQA